MKRNLEKDINKVTLNYYTITRNVKNETLVNTETTKEVNGHVTHGALLG
jgi:hypothetical protein